MSDDSATMWCPRCGSEYVPGIEVCPDCDVDLVTERPAGASPDAAATGEAEYDLAEWADTSRRAAQQLLTAEGVPYAWQGTTLVVPGPLAPRVDGLLGQIEAMAVPELDPDAELVAYDLDEWGAEQVDELLAIIELEGIAYTFDDEGELVVDATNESRVDAIIEGMHLAGDEGEAGTDIDAAALLSDLFIAADRLMRDARDHDGVLGLVDAAEAADGASLPYGFERVVWHNLLSRVHAVTALLEDDDSADADIRDAARSLRDLLRTYV